MEGVLVTAAGDFDATWRSTGITYQVEIESSASAEDVERLIRNVDEIAEIPKALRAGAPVGRVQ